MRREKQPHLASSRARVAVPFGLLCAVACTPTAGLSSGASEADAGDGDSAPAIDGGTSGDATSGGSFCEALASRPALCDAFERSDLQGPWDELVQSAKTQMNITANAVHPDGLGVRIAFPANTDTEPLYSDLTRTFSASSEVTLSFDVKIDALPKSGDYRLVALSAQVGTNQQLDYWLDVDPTRVSLYELHSQGSTALGGGARGLSVPITAGSMHRISLRLAFSPAPKYSLTVDGAAARDGDALAIPNGPVTVYLGMQTNIASGGLTAALDNVVVDTK